jgi:predicted XRE-type DNA-binding protein
MNRDDPRWNDTSITHSCGNVFIDLGFDEAEAHVYTLQAELVIAIERYVTSKKWANAEAARRMKVKLPKRARPVRFAIRDYSLEELLILALRIGLKVDFAIEGRRILCVYEH